MRPIKPEVDLSAMERDILAYWDKHQIFAKSNDLRKNSKEFSFYDGPPFANGLPHYGHLLANTVKDIIPRYWSMKGYHVERRFGWDCHGVPVEYEIEKRDQIKGSQAVKELGIAEFNERCRASVQTYAAQWQSTITRLGRWVDWQNQYRTMDLEFMESVWWVFADLFKKGLVYKSHKVVPYSPRLSAVVSNFEANQNYKDVQDPSLIVKFKLLDEDAYFLAWTTTPWSLPANLALAVHPDFTYAKISEKKTGHLYYLMEDRLEAVFKDHTAYERLATVTGKDLHGRSYHPLFPYFHKANHAFKVLADTYVSGSDGTGIVHVAPAYGEDDLRVAAREGIMLVDPLDEEGRFTDEVPDFAGKFLKDADKDIIRKLKTEDKVFHHETFVHSYPFCERTDTPLIYRAVPAWYVAVEKLTSRLVANNQKINWVPHHLKDGRMGKWLENARDWAISRNRFWGTPLPIWVCQKNEEHIHVVSSVAELEKKTSQKLTDIHKHHVDDLKFFCPSCTGTMVRVPEVFDCWFESGSMPYAQIHYPFAHKEKFEKTFPADFIAEGLDQTRGWFYTLSVLSTALFDKPAFKNVVVNGTICDETGRKMSKRHRNYTPPERLLETYGADATRIYMINSPILRAEDLIFNDKGVVETIRSVLLPLWNAHSFLTTYGNADGWNPSQELLEGKIAPKANPMDRWIISRLHTITKKVHEQMEGYLLYAVVPLVLEFIDDLTNWYIRLNRRRFWTMDGAVDHDAYETLYYVLLTFSKVFAPIAPFITDQIYRNLLEDLPRLSKSGIPSSVHLCDMPQAAEELMNASLEETMGFIRLVTEMGRSLRSKHKIKTRQVLRSMFVVTRRHETQKMIESFGSIIKEELNVKNIVFSTDESSYVNFNFKPNLKNLGKRLGSKLPQLKEVLEKLSQNPQERERFLAQIESADQPVSLMGMSFAVEDFLIDRIPKEGQVVISKNGVTVLLDTTLTPQLIEEGLSREIVNRIQGYRKDKDLHVSSRIKLTLVLDETLKIAAENYRDYIMTETLCEKLILEKVGSHATDTMDQLEMDEHELFACLG